MSQKIFAYSMALIFLAACQNVEQNERNEKADPTPAVFEDDDHNSQNSLNWSGTYVGVLPCADCTGIDTKLTLNQNGTFVLQTQYLGTPEANNFTEKGTFEWDDSGSEITLNGLEYDTKTYKVGENRLWQLDQNGDKVVGDLADYYILKKN